MYAIYIRLQFPFLAPLVPLSCAATLGQMGRRENTVQSFCVHGCRAQYHITRYASGNRVTLKALGHRSSPVQLVCGGCRAINDCSLYFWRPTRSRRARVQNSILSSAQLSSRVFWFNCCSDDQNFVKFNADLKWVYTLQWGEQADLPLILT